MAEVRVTRSRAASTVTRSPASSPAVVVSPSASPSPSPATVTGGTRSTTSSGSRSCLRPRPKILCLGMSYPSVEAQLKHYGLDPSTWLDDGSRVSVEDVVQCVSQGLLTEMDARDLARCVATERIANVDVYTVSQENAAHYDDSRHVWANFNRQTFCTLLVKAFGEGGETGGNDNDVDATKFADSLHGRTNKKDNGSVQFRQAILDYFWIPQGWDVSHWSPTLFTRTLVQFVTEGLLDMEDNSSTVPCGVYIPFCLHCFRQLINALPILREYYAISFLRKKDLGEISLWTGTQSIDPFIMQSCLGKRLDQEDIYCTFGPQEIKQGMSGPNDVSTGELCDILSRLEDFHDIRMMKLRPLKQHNPNKVVPKRHCEQGGLKGLVDPSKVQRGFNAPPPVSVMEPTIGKPQVQHVSPQAVSVTRPSRQKKRRKQLTSNRPKPKPRRELFPSSRTCRPKTRRDPSCTIVTRSRKRAPQPTTAVQPTRTSSRVSTSPFAKKRRIGIVTPRELEDDSGPGQAKPSRTTCRRRLAMDDVSETSSGKQQMPRPKGGKVDEVEVAQDHGEQTATDSSPESTSSQKHAPASKRSLVEQVEFAEEKTERLPSETPPIQNPTTCPVASLTGSPTTSLTPSPTENPKNAVLAKPAEPKITTSPAISTPGPADSATEPSPSPDTTAPTTSGDTGISEKLMAVSTPQLQVPNTQTTQPPSRENRTVKSMRVQRQPKWRTPKWRQPKRSRKKDGRNSKKTVATASVVVSLMSDDEHEDVDEYTGILIKSPPAISPSSLTLVSSSTSSLSGPGTDDSSNNSRCSPLQF